MLRPKPTPRMREIAARVESAWNGAVEKRADRDRTAEAFHRAAMEDIVYLLGKLGVEMKQ